MKQLHDRVGALDVHRDSVVVCARVADGKTITVHKERFGTTTAELSRCGDWLVGHGVTLVVMEASGVYWKPPFYCLEGRFDELWLVNAHHVKNVPGRKTDMNDAEWLADVAAHGMVRPSVVPDEPIRELRELTRYRKTQIEARGREIQRLEKVLQDACIKLTSFTSKVLTKSGREMVEALIAGERDSAKLAGMARGRMKAKTDDLVFALDGHFGSHHAVVARRILDHIDFLDQSIETLTEEVMARVIPFRELIELLDTIPGIDQRSAEVIIAEAGGDMSRWPTAGHFGAWAGVAPASHESAGKRKPAGTRHGGKWLRTTFIESARAASRTTDTYCSAQYRRIAQRRGPNKAAVAVANSIAGAVWHVLSKKVPYQELGGDYFERRKNPEKEARRLVAKLEAMGHKVVIEQAA